MILGIQLKKLLTEKDVTVAQLARATKLSSKTIYSWLSGQSARNLNDLKRVADYFNVSIDYLAFGIEPLKKIEFKDFDDEINAGIYEVVLRKVRK